MSKKSIALLFFLLPMNFISHHSYGWGFWGHQRINRMAVFALPPEMFGFFKYHIDYVTIHAVDPDKRRYAVEGEAACHFLDADHYGSHPFDSIPAHWNDAVSVFSEDSLMAHGIVPWSIQRTYYRLVAAFKIRDASGILKYASDLGHYVGDAHVPLHCTANYNGQLTGQYGIHGLWESRIPELTGEAYDFLTGRSVYLPDPLETAWAILQGSYALHDSVLDLERSLNTVFPADQKYTYELRGAMAVKVYSEEYAMKYMGLMNGMVERRMNKSIQMVASYWYSAWVEAGQPELQSLAGIELDPSQLERLRVEEEGWNVHKFAVPEHE